MLRDSHALFECVGAFKNLVALLDLLREGVELDLHEQTSMTKKPTLSSAESVGLCHKVKIS